MNNTQRIAVIGAGPSGIAALRAFESAEQAGAEVPDIVAFEKQSDWGGQWNFTWRTGMDTTGEPVHSSMYRNLWSNGPKEVLEFAEYTFDEHFGRPISSYPPREVLWDYIDGRMRGSEAKSKVRFNTVVRWVQHRPETDDFVVSSEDLLTGQTRSERFSHVVVATGHFSFPNVPAFEGIETFPGQVMHAHDFRGAEALAGKRVLLVGSSYSAEDIGSQIYKMGAEQVTISYRSAKLGYDWPEGIEEVPLLNRVDGSTVHFADGQRRDVDMIILCTGYRHHYPFMPGELSLSGPNTVYPEGLYRGVVWHENPKVHYLGAQDQWLTYNMFDAQAWYSRDLILGRAELPSAEERAAHMADWKARFAAIPGEIEEARFQCDYVEDLIEQTDYPMFDLDAVFEILASWKKAKKAGIMTYRDHSYRSVMTGTMAAQHHTPWLEELDDSLFRYLMDPEVVAAERADAGQGSGLMR
ncbi:NAD(P)-binding domain-containing protein [Micrococcus lylae]|uniref:NAD(P)-binding domain-containing protein n=1 Tax=Micrococcus lylae TaxID=1273 RepID=UPI003EB77D5E